MSNLSAQKSSLFGKPKASASSSSTSAAAKAAIVPPAPVALPKPVSKTAGMTGLSAGTNKANTSGTMGIILSPQARARKIEEAKEESKIGMDCLKTSVFKWAPDHLAAAPHFESSSNAYKAAGEFKLARLMMLQSADSHEGAGCQAAAAVTCVKAAVIAQTMNRTDYSSADYMRCAELWGIQGDLDKCAEMMARAGKELADDKPAEALDLYKRACDMLCPPETPMSGMSKIHPKAIDIFRDTINFMLRPGEGKKTPLKDGTALEYAERQALMFKAFEMESAMCKALCAVSIIQLAMGDIVSAEQTFLSHLSSKQYIKSTECRVAENLIQALKNHDMDRLDEARADSAFKYLDKEVLAAANRLSVFTSANTKESKAEKEVNRSANQLARDMQDMMKMAAYAPPVEEKRGVKAAAASYRSTGGAAGGVGGGSGSGVGGGRGKRVEEDEEEEEEEEEEEVEQGKGKGREEEQQLEYEGEEEEEEEVEEVVKKEKEWEPEQHVHRTYKAEVNEFEDEDDEEEVDLS